MKTWLITGASRGLGRSFAEAALSRGDRVAATSRHIDGLAPLVQSFGANVLPLVLDTTERESVFAAVERCHSVFGGVDVLVNNAGVGAIGSVEETTEREARGVLDTNFFGPLWLVQAVLPLMRQQCHGHIIQISSVAGLASFPMVGLYNASKWALEGLTEALAQEVGEFGIHVTLLEPGPMRTGWANHSMPLTAAPLDAYAGARTRRLEGMADEYASRQPGDPEQAAQVLLSITDTDKPPLRVILGSAAYDLVVERYGHRLAEWGSSKHVSRSVDFLEKPAS